ncbi:MAG: nicotinate-nucleotide--dimethylbenzimidazole phosphoribosyltransferase [Deltaproteobacteria bacterium]|nr:nicotinate-nucleotide--dimethylbenzimidazole phosphoribosyltransferase [Deltaproteobacteria bacterium]
MNHKIEHAIAHVRATNDAAAAATQALLNAKTKPPGSLGELEGLACRLAAITGKSPPPRLTKAVVVMGADHGVTDEGISAYPAEVTAQMLANFAAGGAAINVLGRQAGATVLVVDMGSRVPPPDGTVLSKRIGPGTRNFAHEPAMTEAQAEDAILAGIEVARGLISEGVNLIALGEMGIGNTTSASALCAALLKVPPAEVTGRGTGIDDHTLAHKVAVIESALVRHTPHAQTPLQTLAAFGGFEIAGLVGVCLAGAAARVPVLLDGFITSVAALVAVRLCPLVQQHLVASHRSVEIGHAAVCKALQLTPLFDLQMRLGEGSGAALAMPMLDAAVAIVHEMATFASAGVSSH